jgi:tRNA(adenine34) deaminase|uniref:CMP/dCMP-type deaminase domain-containing protein n=1 Tax=uncultured bacterium BAC13K9BAC TaxID=332979 RepID=Q4JN08_9BACT|nr:unknown [uncultured bacterium BAC13K9BAC]
MDQQYHLFYELAYNLALVAYNQDEVPVGAVIIKDSTFEVISSGYNKMKQNRSSIDHAEMLALKTAMTRLNNERLKGCSMITTLEPCPMCAQAISFARLSSIIFSAEDKKSGGVINGPVIYNSSSCHHKPSIIRFNDNGRSTKLLKKFFQNKRKNKRN